MLEGWSGEVSVALGTWTPVIAGRYERPWEDAIIEVCTGEGYSVALHVAKEIPVCVHVCVCVCMCVLCVGCVCVCVCVCVPYRVEGVTLWWWLGMAGEAGRNWRVGVYV